MPKGSNPNSRKNLEKRKPFKPNNPETGEKDERINREGRASNFDQLRAVFQAIANEQIGDKTRLQIIGEALSKDKRLMKEFLEFSYGKVPLSQIVDITSGGKPINWKSFIDGSDSDTNTEAGSK